MVDVTNSLRLAPTSLLLLLQFAIASAQGCQKYSITGPSGTSTFNNYEFYDWRGMIDQLSGTPVYTQNMNFDNGQFGMATSSYFNNTPWTDNWSTTASTKLNNVTLSQYVPMVYTPLNVAIVRDSSSKTTDATMLSLSTLRLNSYSTSSQIHTNKLFLHASVRMSARIIGPPGACGAFFLYGDDQNESDIEVLTNDTQPIFHATNHPSQDEKGRPIAGATSQVALPKNNTVMGTANSTLGEWNEYRIDWLPDRTEWIINGVPALTKTMNIPKIASWLGVNMWSNGGSWTGNMSINSTATMEVRWVELVYNTTKDSNADSTGCTVKAVKDANDGRNNLGNMNAASSLSAGASTILTLFSGLWMLYFLWSFDI